MQVLVDADNVEPSRLRVFLGVLAEIAECSGGRGRGSGRRIGPDGVAADRADRGGGRLAAG